MSSFFIGNPWIELGTLFGENFHAKGFQKCNYIQFGKLPNGPFAWNLFLGAIMRN